MSIAIYYLILPGDLGTSTPKGHIPRTLEARVWGRERLLQVQNPPMQVPKIVRVYDIQLSISLNSPPNSPKKLP